MNLPQLESELEQLIPRVARGDREAFSRLYDLTASRLNAVISRIVRKPELAEEALQDAFIRIWQKASLYDARHARSFGWIVAIARNQAIDLKRRFAERLSDASESTHELEIAVPAEAESSLEMAKLRSCLTQLPEERQSLVLLAYYEGYSREELAARFSRPVTTIKTVLRRSLKLLKECLDGRS